LENIFILSAYFNRVYLI